MDIYELKTVSFGVNCAPFLTKAKWPLASKILREMMYVDDALVGAHDLPCAIKTMGLNRHSRIQSLETKSDRRTFEPVDRSVPEFHSSSNCAPFLTMKRGTRVKSCSLCINCLTATLLIPTVSQAKPCDRLNECKSTIGCSVCKLKQHTLLHREVSRSSSGAFDASGSRVAIWSGGEVQNRFAATSS